MIAFPQEGIVTLLVSIDHTIDRQFSSPRVNTAKDGGGLALPCRHLTLSRFVDRGVLRGRLETSAIVPVVSNLCSWLSKSIVAILPPLHV